MADAANNKTSYLVNTQLPEFVRRDHPKFVEFLESYYKFLEQDGEALYTAKRFGEFYDLDIINQDILDETGEMSPDELDRYHILRQKLYDNYIAYIPQNSQADLNLVLKHAQDFYRSTGSQKSVRFLTQSLFKKQPEIYYPQDNILKASDGKWFIEKSLNIKDIAVDNVANSTAFTRFVNQTIVGLTSNSSCKVEAINPYYSEGILITEIKVSSVDKDFINGETLVTTIEDEGVYKTLSANLYSGIITRVTVTNAGSGYTQGAGVPIIAANGQGGSVIISKVGKAHLEGKIKAIKILYPGAGYRVNDTLLFTGGGGSNAAANVSIVDISETYHPANYNIVGSRIIDVANTVIQNAIGDVVETQSYSNLATINISTSNLDISTINGTQITNIFLSQNLANSNNFIETGDYLFCQNTYQLITGSNRNYWQITVNPGLPGGLHNVSFQIIKKPNVNTVVANSMLYWQYANCGPIVATAIINQGSGYITLPQVSIISNTAVRSLGILGRMDIYNGGVGYQAGDVIQFQNQYGCYGVGANAQISVVDSNGSILQVNWFALPGHLPGGSGYRQDMLPNVVIISQNTAAYGANVMVTAILGDGGQLNAVSNVIGTIQEIKVVSGGFGYDEAPIIDLSTQGDGTGEAYANIVTGVYSYPGRYLNQDGQPSSYNFLQNRDYYQKFSYVIKIDESLDAFRKPMKDLIHPAGLKMFGQFITTDPNQTSRNPVMLANSILIVSNTTSNTIIAL
jgi:hypothetical protein